MTFDHKREKLAVYAAIFVGVVIVSLWIYGLILAFKPY